MSRKKVSLLIQLINTYTQLSDADKTHFSDFVRSQSPSKPKAETRTQSSTADSKLKQLRERTGATRVNCVAVLQETGNDLATAEELLRARKLAPKPVVNDVEG